MIWSFSFGATFDAYLLELARARGKPNPNAFVGSVETVRGMVTLVLALPLGMLADKFSRRRMMQTSALPGTVGVIVLASGIALDSEILIYVGVVVAALFMQIFSSCGSAFLADCVPSERLTEVMALQGSLFLVGYSVGPLAQVILISSVGNTWNLPELHVILCAGFALWPLVLPAFFLFEKTPAEREADLQRTSASESSSSPLNASQSIAEVQSWKNERFLGLRKKWSVPLLIEFCSLITATGAGMTVKFFPLFFKEDYSFSPIALNALSASYTISIALFVQICNKVSSRIGRCQAAALWQVSGVLALFALWKAQPLPLVIFLYIIRGSFANALGPINTAVIMDCVDRKFRGRWSAIQSVSRFTWSGSAVLGGWLADAHDYRYTFFITGIIYASSAVLYSPLLGVVPAKTLGSGASGSLPAAVASQADGDAERGSESLEANGASAVSLQPVDVQENRETD